MHSLAFKRYTQIYALLYTLIFMMTFMYIPQILDNMYINLQMFLNDNFFGQTTGQNFENDSFFEEKTFKRV